jgi:hypothetical protein
VIKFASVRIAVADKRILSAHQHDHNPMISSYRTIFALFLYTIYALRCISNSDYIKPKRLWKIDSSILKKVIVGSSALISLTSSPISNVIASSASPSTIVLATSATEDDDYANTSEIENLRSLQFVRKPPSAFKTFFRNKVDLENLGEMPEVPIGDDMEDLNESEDRILTLKAYLDETERDVFNKNWSKLVAYLNIFTEQENAFANLINGLFPGDGDLDKAGRDELKLEAQTMFLAIDDLREAAKDHKFEEARAMYAKLLLAYDRFLKAGNLYPSYDVITSTEVLFKDTPRSTLRFDTTSKPSILDKVVLTYGPDMGKVGTIINIDRDNMAVVKFDKDENYYQEVKEVELSVLAKSLK